MLFLGDSITSDKLSSRKIIKGVFDNNVFDYAISCSRTINILALINDSLRQVKPDVVSILIGTNDYVIVDREYGNNITSIKEYERNLKIFVRKSKGYEKIILDSIPMSNCEVYNKSCELTKFRGILTSVGADLVVDTRVQNLPEVLKTEEKEGRAIDIAIDCLGGQNLGDCLPYVKYGCRWIVIAALAGIDTTINLKTIYKKNIRIIGSTLRSRTPKMKAEILNNLVNEVWEKVSSGKIKPTVYKILPITKAEEAQDILYRGENIGKVVLQVK